MTYWSRCAFKVLGVIDRVSDCSLSPVSSTLLYCASASKLGSQEDERELDNLELRVENRTREKYVVSKLRRKRFDESKTVLGCKKTVDMIDMPSIDIIFVRVRDFDLKPLH